MAKVNQKTSCLDNCPILGSPSLVSALRALSQPSPGGLSWSFSKCTPGENRMKAGKRWRFSLLRVEKHWPIPLASTIMRSMLNPWRGTGVAGLFSKHRSLSFLLHKVPRITVLYYQVPLGYSPGLPNPRALEVWVTTDYWGVETDQMLQHSKFMRFKPFFFHSKHKLFSFGQL